MWSDVCVCLREKASYWIEYPVSNLINSFRGFHTNKRNICIEYVTVHELIMVHINGKMKCGCHIHNALLYYDMCTNEPFNNFVFMRGILLSHFFFHVHASRRRTMIEFHIWKREFYWICVWSDSVKLIDFRRQNKCSKHLCNCSDEIRFRISIFVWYSKESDVFCLVEKEL